MKLLKPTAMSLVALALAFAVPAFLPTGLSAQSKPATAVETTQAAVTTSNNSQKKDPTPVRIVCLSTEPENFFRNRIAKEGEKESKEAKEMLEDLQFMRLLSGFENFAGLGKKATSALEKMFPPVGGWYYLPLGSGFVVDDEGQYVITNWHVANACKQSLEFKTQLGILESSGRVVEPLRAELMQKRTIEDVNGKKIDELYAEKKLRAICSNGEKQCSKTRLKGVDFYIPDLALLQINKAPDGKYARTPPILLADPSAFSKDLTFKDKGAALTIAGFPQVIMDAKSGATSPSIQSTVAIYAPARYSNDEKFEDKTLGKAVGDENEVTLMLLSAQIHSGNSGGPVLLNDKVIGVVTSSFMQEFGNRKVDALTNLDETAIKKSAVTVPAGYGLAVNVKEIMDMIKWFQKVTPAGIAAAIPSPTPVPAPVPAPVICKSNEVKVDGKCELVPTPFWKSPLILGLLGLITIVAGTFFWMIRSNKEKVIKEPAIVNPNTVIHVENPKPQDVPVRKADTLVAVRLRGSHGNFNDKVFSIPTPNGVNALMVGRDPAVCQITFPNQLDTVSKRHCIFNWIQATRTFTVEDLGSTWGTFVNGKKIVKGEKVTLKNGDTVDLAADKTNRFSVEIV